MNWYEFVFDKFLYFVFGYWTCLIIIQIEKLFRKKKYRLQTSGKGGVEPETRLKGEPSNNKSSSDSICSTTPPKR